MQEQRASHTAVIVCQARAVAHDRLAKGRFADPTAFPLLRTAEQAPVLAVRAEAPPKPLAERLTYEMLRGSAELLVARTVAIDDAVLACDAPQVVILGAGLDGRSWRMPTLAGRAVFEVDHPASQAEKRVRARVLDQAYAPRFVPVDFTRDRLADALAGHGHDPDVPTLWVWEGVVAYLTPEQVTTTVAALGGRSAPGSRLIVNYQAPSPVSAVLRRLISLLMGAFGSNPWAGEPWRSAWTPATIGRVLTDHGFEVRSDVDLMVTASALDMPVDKPGVQRNSRVAVAVKC